MNDLIRFLFASILFIFGGCTTQQNRGQQSIVQISTIDALLQEVYDGQTTLTDIGELGNFGIGTFNGLDGEMLMVDGKFYQIKSNVSKCSYQTKANF